MYKLHGGVCSSKCMFYPCVSSPSLYLSFGVYVLRCVHTRKDIKNEGNIYMTRRGLTHGGIYIRKSIHAEGYTYGGDINIPQRRHTHEETCVSAPYHVVSLNVYCGRSKTRSRSGGRDAVGKAKMTDKTERNP